MAKKQKVDIEVTEDAVIDVSEKNTWAGFKISTNLISAIKNSLYVLVPAIAMELATKNLISTALAGALGSAICKAIEFWHNE